MFKVLFQCPYCGANEYVDDHSEVHRECIVSLESGVRDSFGFTENFTIREPSKIKVVFDKCSKCMKYTIRVKGMGTVAEVSGIDMRISSIAKQYYEHIPKQIRLDYEEACAVLELSPKSAATLARRCIQGMIRDKWKIVKKNLYEEISALEDKVRPELWSAINNARGLGNIGAHMEKDTNLIIDITSNEAMSLIKLIEILIDEWYIKDIEKKKVFDDIAETNAKKQELKKERSVK